MKSRSPTPGSELPRLAAAILRALFPPAEREEVLSELGKEYAQRRAASGRLSATGWIYREILNSAPALVSRAGWRGWTGFTPASDRWKPGGSNLENWVGTLKFSLRRLGRNRAYAVISVVTLSLGVAGIAAVYSIAKPLLLDPLPIASEEEVYAFWRPFEWSEAEFEYLHPSYQAFSSVAGYRESDVTLRVGEAPARLVTGISASADLFRVLGVSPQTGPGFGPEVDRTGSEPVAVISHSLWRELGSPSDIVGTRLELGGGPRTIVGVMPEEFWFPDPTTEVWLSEEMDPSNGSGNYALLARLRPGFGSAAASAEVARITQLLGEQFTYPEEWDKTRDAAVTPIREFLVGSLRPAMWGVFIAMAILLLVAGANVSALMLGQFQGRGTEMAVRRALGAESRHLLRQLVVESLLIGALAGVGGALLASVIFRLLVQALPLGDFAASYGLNWTVFAAAIVAALLAATAVTILPAFLLRNSAPGRGLARSRTGGVEGRGGALESGLVVAQIALVLLLAGSGGLLLRSVVNIRAIDPGIVPENVGVIDVVLPGSYDVDRSAQALNQLSQSLAELPGVASAAAAQALPLRGIGNNWGIIVEERPDLPNATTYIRAATPDYFQSVQVELLSGRDFTESDRQVGDEGVVVINEALAATYFPNSDPIGRRISFGDRWDRIIGIVENVPEGDLTPDVEPARYYLYEHLPALLPRHSFVLRTEAAADVAPLLDLGRRQITTAAPDLAIQEVTTMEQIYNRSIGPAGQLTVLLVLMSLLALILGLVGVYGVVSHYVAKRNRDWGIRLALGLRPQGLVRQILYMGGTVVGTGILLGVTVLLASSHLLAAFLYNVGSSDPMSVASAAGLIFLSGLLAAYLPARRASRIDPVRTLRQE